MLINIINKTGMLNKDNASSVCAGPHYAEIQGLFLLIQSCQGVDGAGDNQATPKYHCSLIDVAKYSKKYISASITSASWLYSLSKYWIWPKKKVMRTTNLSSSMYKTYKKKNLILEFFFKETFIQ